MKKFFKRTLLCLTAAAMLAVSGTTFAEDDTPATEASSETEAGSETVSAKLSESEEIIPASYEDITEYLQKIGSADGIDIYLKDKNIEDIIWEKNGGKPAKKSDCTDAQNELKKRIDAVKKLGELTAVDPKTKTALATFDQSSKCDEGKLHVSSGRRYLLYTDSDMTRVIRIRRVISTIDDPCLFSSIDGKTLDLMDRELKKALVTLKYDSIEEGRKVYRSDDKKSFAWLTADGKQVIGAYRCSAENESFRLLVNDRLGNVGIENKATGYIWWSSPLGASRDDTATPLIVNELRSSAVLRYGIPTKRSNNNFLRSATDDCTIEVKDITNGIRVTYKFPKAGFEFPAEYTLEGDHLKAAVKVSEIKETSDTNIATELTLMNSFGAADDTEDGYFLIPDGSGALIRFNNHKNSDSNIYSRTVYGNDITAVPTSRGAVAEQIYLPVYGIVKEDNALLAVASKGDSNACLTAKVSGQSNSRYNICGFTFILRGTDIFYMSGSSSDKMTVFESGDIRSDDIEVLYYPILAENAGYIDIAERYRRYLTEDMGVAKKTDGSAPLYVSLYGGVQRKKPILGIPVTMKQSVTSFDEAKEILTDLKINGADEMVVTYKNWTTNGIKSRIDTKASPSGTLGGSSGFKQFRQFAEENDIALYPSTDNRCFLSGSGFNSFSDTCVRISGAYSRIVSYDRAYGIPDGFKDNMSLLSPGDFSAVFGDIAKSYSSAGLDGTSLGSFSSALYGDYGKRNISRAKAKELLVEGFGTVSEQLDGGILAETANAYVLPYVQHITNVPMTSSRFDIFNEDVPFYQAVIHGLIPYSSSPVNGDPDPSKHILMSAATGSLPSYDLLYEETSKLKDTDFDVYYYANYTNWTESAASEHKLLKPLYEAVSEAYITDCTVENGGSIINTGYSNGIKVTADLEAGTIIYNGKLIDLSAAKGGE